MKFAGRKLSHLTTIALIFALGAVGLGVADWVISSRSVQKLEAVKAEAVRIDENSDLAALEGRIVYVSGMATGSNDTRDSDFNLNLPLLRLERQSEILQWRESGSKFKNYEVEWGPEEADSREFRTETGHENRGAIEYPAYATEPMRINIISGGKALAALDSSYLRYMGEPRKVTLTPSMYEAMPAAVKRRFGLVNGSLVEARDGLTDKPMIGDNRTRFVGVSPAVITVVGALRAGVVVPEHPSLGAVAVLRPGLVDIGHVFDEVAYDFRASAIALVIVAGFMMLLAILMAVVDFGNATRIREIVRFGRGG